jgi:Rhodopirellula transposase DDE domain
VNDEADASDTQLRVSCDAKAAIKIGDYSRLGSSRVKVQAADHDFKPKDVIVPYGICLPKHKELSLYLTHSKVTSDFIVDCLEAWWTDMRARGRFPKVSMLVLDLDNGPENQSRRTQFMKRMVEFVDRHRIDVRLAYYPPYHSKYNPIERCWGWLEQHWNGTLLDSVAAVVGYAESFRWHGQASVVRVIHQVYQTGVRLTKALMAQVESRLSRFESLGRWFVDIACAPTMPLRVTDF